MIDQTLECLHWTVIGCELPQGDGVNLHEADSLGQWQFQERDDSVSHQQPILPADGKCMPQSKCET